MNLLFCTGVPKSGTTFLQMILNAHPAVSCPSEHQFNHFREGLSRLFTEYNRLLRDIDRRTAKQGACTFQNEDAAELFQLVVRLAAMRGAQGRDVVWHGLNDNQILYDPTTYFSFFPDSRFICIVRDPRAMILSSWHHNLRIEPGFRERAKNLEHWAGMLGGRWQRDMARLQELEKNADAAKRLHYCRYEELASRHRPAFRALFEFLDLDTPEETVEAIIEATRFDKLRNGPFFRKAQADESWRDELSEKALKNVEAKAGEGMKRFGYLT